MLDKRGPTHSHLGFDDVSSALLTIRLQTGQDTATGRPPRPFMQGHVLGGRAALPAPGPRPPALFPFSQAFSLTPSLQLSPTVCLSPAEPAQPSGQEVP